MVTGADSDLMSQYFKVAPILWGHSGGEATELVELSRKDVDVREDGPGGGVS